MINSTESNTGESIPILGSSEGKIPGPPSIERESTRVLFRDCAVLRTSVMHYSEKWGRADSLVVDQTIKLLTSVGAVLRLHHCPPELRQKFYDGASRYLCQAGREDEWLRLAKYFLAYPLARYLRCEEPVRPSTDCGIFFHRRFHTWLEKRFEVFSQKNTWFFTSWLQCKRACNALSDNEIIGAFCKHRKGMQTQDPLSKRDLEEIFRPGTNFVSLLKLVNKRLHKKWKKRMGPVSQHASFESTRFDGGQRDSLILRAMGLQQEFLKQESKLGSCTAEWFKTAFDLAVLKGGGFGQDLYAMTYLPGAVDSSFRPTSPIVEVKALPILAELEQDFRSGSVCSTELDHPVLRGDFTPMLDLGLLGRLPYCKAAPVLEPLKVRMISKGEAKLYYDNKWLQLDLHNVLRKIPLFKLIGRPASPTDISSLVTPDLLLRYGRPLWCSGDYEAATDNLSASLGYRILSEVLDGLPVEIGDSALRALGAHEVEYPVVLLEPFPAELMDMSDDFDVLARRDGLPEHGVVCDWFNHSVTKWLERFDLLGEKEAQRLFRPVPPRGTWKTVNPPLDFGKLKIYFSWGERPGISCQVQKVTQTNGQLMGSIVSFLVLCLANGAVLDLFQRGDPLERSLQDYIHSADINGDDLLTVVDGKDEFNRFAQVASTCGLKMSVGKSYYHPTYANINSTAFHYNLENQKAYLEEGWTSSPDGIPNMFCKEHVNGPSPEVPCELGYFNVGLYTENHKVMDRVGADSAEYLNNSATSTEVGSASLPESWTEIQSRKLFYTELPKGAFKLKERLKLKGIAFPGKTHRPLYAIANRIVSGAPDDQKISLLSELSQRIADYGEDILFYRGKGRGHGPGKWKWLRRNHFLPISLGGLGLVAGKYRYKVTEKQRRLANYLRSSRHLRSVYFSTQLPFPKPYGKFMPVVRHPFDEQTEPGSRSLLMTSKIRAKSIEDFSSHCPCDAPMICAFPKVVQKTPSPVRSLTPLCVNASDVTDGDDPDYELPFDYKVKYLKTLHESRLQREHQGRHCSPPLYQPTGRWDQVEITCLGPAPILPRVSAHSLRF